MKSSESGASASRGTPETRKWSNLSEGQVLCLIALRNGLEPSTPERVYKWIVREEGMEFPSVIAIQGYLGALRKMGYAQESETPTGKEGFEITPAGETMLTMYLSLWRRRSAKYLRL